MYISNKVIPRGVVCMFVLCKSYEQYFLEYCDFMAA